MRRLNARNYAVYLQRRAGDYVDRDQPAPRWTDLDREAIHELLRGFRYLEQCYDLAVAELHAAELEIPLPVDPEEADPLTWFLEPVAEPGNAAPKRARRA